MKKVFISVLIIIFFILNTTSIVNAAASTWVKDAFSSTKSFLNQTSVEEKLGFENDIFTFIKEMIKSINVILLIILGAVSTIAISVTGIKFILAAGPGQKADAQKSLKTAFIGMCFGFGAYAIWSLGISIVMLIVGAIGG